MTGQEMVGAIMTAAPRTIDRNAGLDAAVTVERLMVSWRIGCLPVVRRGVLVGLVTESDVVRHAYDV